MRMFSIEYGQCATNHPAHCKLVINSIRQLLTVGRLNKLKTCDFHFVV